MDKQNRKAIIAGNWKMNKTATEAKALISELIPAVKDAGCEVVICVPFTDLVTAVEMTKGTNIHVGAENVHFEKSGAFTGEISASMLLEESCSYCLVGHSERRHLFNETNEQTAKKVDSLCHVGITPILCVGELLAERESHQTHEVVKTQLLEGIKNFSPADKDVDKHLVIAYEPVWAIGTGKTATPKDAQEVCHYIRGLIETQFGADCAKKIRILYGGSVTAATTEALLAEADVDGVLVGGASVKAVSFQDILVEAAK